MKNLSALMSEFSAVVKNRKTLISVIGVLFVPLLYGSTLLWAFWDPYGHVEKLPVAVVNEDKGAEMNGEKIAIGDELVENLKEEKKFDWKFVSKKEAEKGLQEQTYYMMIEIPKDFSQNATTLQEDHPKKSDLVYTANEGLNFLSAKMGDSAIELIKEEVSNNITETYAETVFADIKDVSEGLADASEGAGELHDGINSAKDGTEEIRDGIDSAKGGADELHNGINSAKSGVDQLYTGLSQTNKGASDLHEGINSAKSGAGDLSSGLEQSLAGMNEMNSKLPELTKGTEQISSGAGQLASAVEQWQEGAEKTKAGAADISKGLDDMMRKIDEILVQTTDEQQQYVLESLKANLVKLSEGNKKVEGGLAGLSDGASQIKHGADELSTGASRVHQGSLALGDGMKRLIQGQEQLATGSKELSVGLGELSAGSGKLQIATNQLAQGSNEIAGGMGKLSDGSDKLANGIDKLSDGSGELTKGMDKLSNGSDELASKLSDGAKETGDVKANDDVYDMFADPVHVKETKINQVPNYGTGVAPYFLSLSLFVGGLVLSIVFPFYEPANVPNNGFSWFIGKFGVVALAGIIQALLVDAILLIGLGMEVQSVPLFLLLSIITSLTFMALIQMLVTPFGNPGRFIAIIILILQLSTSAGTFPLELIPDKLQPFHDWLPMSYSVAGFKAVISSGDFAFMWENAATLGIFFAIAIAGTIAYFSLQHKRQFAVMEEDESVNA
ncbi:YhgE/Pip domain-containing protein [Priestia abyssalis]|uniref:YhgE/Pip domain-containing protein n=1 Tax=Priestia abyssalis TaxID=1221450 RepID=UPI000994D1B4|nr:YhgE/Pip domain-containing protein [Priestia abyssalis]